MKKYALIVLLSVVTLAGCDNNKTRCLKDRTAKGCPLSEENIIRTPAKSWSFSKEN